MQVTVINFTVTMTGLEDQLLVDVVKSERPDLEIKKDELVRENRPGSDRLFFIRGELEKTPAMTSAMC